MMDRLIISRIVLVIAIVTMLLGTGCLVGTGVVAWNRKTFLANSSKVEAVVVEMESKAENGITLWRPILDYADASGARHRFASTIWSNPPGYKVGDKVTLLVSDSDPAHPYLDSFFDVWFVPVLVGGFGVLDLIVGFGFLVASILLRRKTMPAPPVPIPGTTST